MATLHNLTSLFNCSQNASELCFPGRSLHKEIIVQKACVVLRGGFGRLLWGLPPRFWDLSQWEVFALHGQMTTLGRSQMVLSYPARPHAALGNPNNSLGACFRNCPRGCTCFTHVFLAVIFFLDLFFPRNRQYLPPPSCAGTEGGACGCHISHFGAWSSQCP